MGPPQPRWWKSRPLAQSRNAASCLEEWVVPPLRVLVDRSTDCPALVRTPRSARRAATSALAAPRSALASVRTTHCWRPGGAPLLERLVLRRGCGAALTRRCALGPSRRPETSPAHPTSWRSVSSTVTLSLRRCTAVSGGAGFIISPHPGSSRRNLPLACSHVSQGERKVAPPPVPRRASQGDPIRVLSGSTVSRGAVPSVPIELLRAHFSVGIAARFTEESAANCKGSGSGANVRNEPRLPARNRNAGHAT